MNAPQAAIPSILTVPYISVGDTIFFHVSACQAAEAADQHEKRSTLLKKTKNQFDLTIKDLTDYVPGKPPASQDSGIVESALKACVQSKAVEVFSENKSVVMELAIRANQLIAELMHCNSTECKKEAVADLEGRISRLLFDCQQQDARLTGLMNHEKHHRMTGFLLCPGPQKTATIQSSVPNASVINVYTYLGTVVAIVNVFSTNVFKSVLTGLNAKSTMAP